MEPESTTTDGTAPIAPARQPDPQFAHPSEAEFARILDFYRIEWQYEPRSFPLRRDADGRVTEQFTPDFYLPELDLYIELTTLKQSLVTKKNRKLRRLRELYPDIKIKLLYNRDYRSLLLKYGLRPAAVLAPAPAPRVAAAGAAPNGQPVRAEPTAEPLAGESLAGRLEEQLRQPAAGAEPPGAADRAEVVV
jgi:hypoxanthine phosphoribosyltransferase